MDRRRFSLNRKKMFPHLGEMIYADWTGRAVYPISLVRRYYNKLASGFLGNPHSHHALSELAFERIQETRQAILDYFNASRDEYEVIFTSNATAAIRVLQHFLFDGGELLLTVDNHNSVNGLREDAKRKGAKTRYAPMNEDLTINVKALQQMLEHPETDGYGLFGYPAKSNYTGAMHSLEWVSIARSLGWSVLLDAAAYASNDYLDLSQVKPDFVPISFYKMFGFPTGVGCLLIKREAYDKLHKEWFSGGTILIASVKEDFYAPAVLNCAQFEDGTPNIDFIPAVIDGLEFIKSLGNRKSHAVSLATKLRDGLTSFNIDYKKSWIIIYSERGNDTVTFNVALNGEIFDAEIFVEAASKEGICLRDGCHCNPGISETIFGYDIKKIQRLYNDTIDRSRLTIRGIQKRTNNKPMGAVRASFGYVNDEEDVKRILEFTEKFLRGDCLPK